MVVDHRMDVVVPIRRLDPGVSLDHWPPAASGWDPAQLLHVDVDELRRSLSLIAQRALPAGSDHLAVIGALRKPRHAGRRSTRVTVRSAPRSGGPVGLAAAVLRGRQDSALTRRRCAEANDEVGSNVLESGQTLLVEAPHQRWAHWVRFPSLWRHGQQACLISNRWTRSRRRVGSAGHYGATLKTSWL